MIEEKIPGDLMQDIPQTSRPKWRFWLAAGGCFVILCGTALIGSVFIAGPKFVQKFIPQQIHSVKGTPLAPTQNNTMGNPDAPVHIIEYGDFQCPYCLKFWTDTEPQLIAEYVNTDKVYFEYRSVGAFLGTESAWAAEGAYCAGDQGRFWEYHDTLFSNWTGENVGDFTKDKLVSYARTLDLNMDEFESCISGEKHKGTVEQDAAQAEADGVHATPTLFINGIKLEGAQPFSILKQYIDQILDGALDIQSG
ncbi:MAG: DsbA family protein [Chloroflexi bacterium]|nr:DsbA family protein [Chloroflexota bacterium]